MKLHQSYLLLLCFSIVLCLNSCSNRCEKQSEEISEEKTKALNIADQLLHQIDIMYNENADSTLNYIFKLIHSDSVINSPLVYYNLIEKLAIAKSYSGEIDSSLYYFTLANNYWAKDTSAIGKKHYSSTLFNIAYSYYQKNEYGKAIDLFNQAAAYSEKTNYYQSAVNANILLSNIYQSEGEYGKALECIEKSIHLCHQQKDSTSIIPALQSYADLYTNCCLYDEAEQQFNDVLKYQEHSSPYSKFCYFNGKGRMYYLKGNYTNAKKQFLKALEQADKNDSYSCMIALFNLAETSLLLNDIDSSKIYLDSAGRYKDELNNMPLFNFNYNSLLGEYHCKKGQFAIAGRAFATADSIGRNTNIDKVISKLHQKRKIRFFAATNKFSDAYSQSQEYDKLNQLILEEDNRKQVAGLKYKFQRDTTIISQRNDIELGKQQIESFKYQQIVYIISIVVLFGFTALIILYYRKVRALTYEKEIRKIAALKMESIRGRISPHFTFNALNNIWAIIDNKENARVQFDNLTTLIRHSLTNTEKLGIPLETEIDFVMRFIELQQLMMGNELNVIWDIEPNINLNQLVPGMIIQIPVENAIKHGLAPKKENRTLHISLNSNSESLVITITDNGIGLPRQISSNQNTGTGLKVLTGTIQILNHINDKKMTFEMKDLERKGLSGTEVIISIPYQYCYNI